MSSSFDTIRKVSEDIERRKAAGGGGGGSFFRLPEAGDSAVVRFIVDDKPLTWAWCHSKKNERGQWRSYPCLDQDAEGEPTGDACPGCEQGGDVAKRRFRGFINLIWRDAPVFARDEDNKFIKGKDGKYVVSGHQDRVATWEQGIEVFKKLQKLDANYKGLMSRDFRITREGEGMSTVYEIFPAEPDGGPQELSDNDKALLAGDLPDLNKKIAKQTYDEWGTDGGGQQQEESTSVANGTTKQDNPFLKVRSGT